MELWGWGPLDTRWGQVLPAVSGMVRRALWHYRSLTQAGMDLEELSWVVLLKASQLTSETQSPTPGSSSVLLTTP